MVNAAGPRAAAWPPPSRAMKIGGCISVARRCAEGPASAPRCSLRRVLGSRCPGPPERWSWAPHRRCARPARAGSGVNSGRIRAQLGRAGLQTSPAEQAAAPSSRPGRQRREQLRRGCSGGASTKDRGRCRPLGAARRRLSEATSRTSSRSQKRCLDERYRWAASEASYEFAAEALPVRPRAFIRPHLPAWSSGRKPIADLDAARSPSSQARDVASPRPPDRPFSVERRLGQGHRRASTRASERRALAEEVSVASLACSRWPPFGEPHVHEHQPARETVAQLLEGAAHGGGRPARKPPSSMPNPATQPA